MLQSVPGRAARGMALLVRSHLCGPLAATSTASSVVAPPSCGHRDYSSSSPNDQNDVAAWKRAWEREMNELRRGWYRDR